MYSFSIMFYGAINKNCLTITILVVNFYFITKYIYFLILSHVKTYTKSFMFITCHKTAFHDDGVKRLA